MRFRRYMLVVQLMSMVIVFASFRSTVIICISLSSSFYLVIMALDVIILARPHATSQGSIHDLKKQVACAIIHMFQKLCHIMNAQILQSLQQFPQSCMRCTLCHARDNAKVRLIEARAILGRLWIKCVHAAGWVPHIRWEISHQLLVQCLGHIRYNDMAVHTHTERPVGRGRPMDPTSG